MRRTVCGILIFFLLGGLLFALQPEDVAYQFLNHLVNQDFENAIGMCNDVVKQRLTPEALNGIWSSLIDQMGKFIRVLSFDSGEQSGYVVVVFVSEFERGNLSIVVSVDKDGKVGGLFFQNAPAMSYQLPSYVNPERVRKEKVTVGEGKWKLPGELVIPEGTGPFPCVVLIHGSGPNDMDETVGPNKIFKDIAYGLASRGIAVLRYHKRTYVYASEIDPLKITVEDEVIEDALSAVAFLREREYIGEVFILGHSLGAMLAPEIAERSEADGIIMLAAPARPLEELMIDQLRYLRSRGMPVEDSQIETLIKLKNNELSPETFVLGAPASYYYDLRNRVPIDLVKKIDKPVLLIHGGRDYQVTRKDYDIWRSELEGLENVTLLLFEDLNHLMISGHGFSYPMEYLKVGHVDQKVIETIVDWIVSQL